MGEVYSHLSEKERRVIQIEIGNGSCVRSTCTPRSEGRPSISWRIVPDRTSGKSVKAQLATFAQLSAGAKSCDTSGET